MSAHNKIAVITGMIGQDGSYLAGTLLEEGVVRGITHLFWCASVCK